jgi:tetratricopeptide (TPR) repeat protein
VELLHHDVVRYAIAGLILIVLVVAARRAWQWVSTREDRELERAVREAVAAGDLRRAGDLQAKRGLLMEASRIFLRAGEHARAAQVLAELGEIRRAAEEYEKADEWGRAAPLYRKSGEVLKAATCYEKCEGRSDRLSAAECYRLAGEHLKAARLFQELEQFEKAADCYAKVEELDALDVALTMLENAALAAKTDPAQRQGLWRRAAELAVKLGAHERAARAFDEAGEPARAAQIYEEALKNFEMAAALYAEAGDDTAATRLSAVAGEGAVRATRAARARARGERAEAEERDARSRSTEGESTVLASDGGGTKATVRFHAKEDAGRDGPARGASNRLEDRFELCGEIGRGGMGIVHKAKDLRLDRFVALKFLPGDVEPGSTMHRLFHREARAAAALSHAGIVTVYDVGELGGREFIAMELVDGKTFDRVLEDEGPVPVAEAMELMERVLEAIEYAHGKSVIHRDLKPANLMRTATGIKVMDFGLAKVVTSKSSGQTVIGGTPSYMPPEQREGIADHRSDVFALGATFYEIMSGVLPGNPGEPASRTSDYPTLRDRVPAVPLRLSDLVMRCLEHERAARPQDVVSVLAELREIRSLVAKEPEVRPRRAASPAVEAKPKAPPEEPIKKRAPLPRIAREEEEDGERAPRIERVGPAPAPRAPTPDRPKRGGLLEVVDTSSRRGKPR